MSLPSGASPWNGIFGRVKRSKYNMGGEGDRLKIVQEMKIGLTTKSYMHKSEFAQENETYKIIWDLRYKQII